MPSPNGLQTGIPIGQPNSTVLMFSPMRFRSSGEGSPFSQSRTGSPPDSVLKKIAGTRFPCPSNTSGGVPMPVGDLGVLPTEAVYHVRYMRTSKLLGFEI